MSYAYVQTAALAAAGSSPTSLSTTAFGSNPTVNNLLVVGCWGLANSPVLTSANTTCSDNVTGASYSQLVFAANAFNYWMCLFYYVVGSTGSSFAPKVSFSANTPTSANIAAAEFSGGATSSPLDTSVTGSQAFATTWSPGNMTITSGDLVCSIYSESDAGTHTPTTPTGFTNIAKQSNGGSFGIGSFDYAINPTSPTNPSYNAPGSGSAWGNSGQACWLKSAGGGSRGLFIPASLVTGAGGSFFGKPFNMRVIIPPLPLIARLARG